MSCIRLLGMLCKDSTNARNGKEKHSFFRFRERQTTLRRPSLAVRLILISFRATHYRHFTGERWGNPKNYDLLINTGSVPIEMSCDMVAMLFKEKQKASRNK